MVNRNASFTTVSLEDMSDDEVEARACSFLQKDGVCFAVISTKWPEEFLVSKALLLEVYMRMSIFMHRNPMKSTMLF